MQHNKKLKNKLVKLTGNQIITLCLLILLLTCCENHEKLIKSEYFNIKNIEFTIRSDSTQNTDYFIPISILADSNDFIYMLDAIKKEIKVFNSDGNFLNTISKQGEGPGELSIPTEMHFDNQQNLIVYDIQLRRFSKFSKNGENIGNISFNKKVYKFNIDRYNNFYIEHRNNFFDKKNNTLYTKAILNKYDSKLNLINKIDSAEFKTSILILKPVRMRFGLPFASNFLWDLNDDGTLLTAETEKNKVKIFNKNNAAIEIDLNPTTKVKLNSEERNNYFDDIVIATSDGDSKVPESIKNQIPFPNYKPYINSIKSLGNYFLIQTNVIKDNYTQYEIIHNRIKLKQPSFLLSQVFNNLAFVYKEYLFTREYHSDDYHIISKYSYNDLL